MCYVPIYAYIHIAVRVIGRGKRKSMYPEGGFRTNDDPCVWRGGEEARGKLP